MPGHERHPRALARWRSTATPQITERPRDRDPARRPTNANTPSQVSTEELLLELRRRIIASRDRRPESWDAWDGLDSDGDWPEQG